MAGVRVLGVAAVDAAEEHGQGVGMLWNHNKMNVIPAAGIRLPYDDQVHSLARTEAQGLRRSQNAIVVVGFNPAPCTTTILARGYAGSRAPEALPQGLRERLRV